MSGPGESLAASLVAALDEPALDALAERLTPRLQARLAAELRSDPDEWLGSRQAAVHLGMTVNALHRLTAARGLPFAQRAPGCRCYFRRSELDRWLEGRRRGA